MNALRSCLRPVAQLAREAFVRSEAMIRPGQGPLAVLLPAYGRQGAALLRIYNVATALRRCGWRTLVLPPALSLRQRRRLLGLTQPDVLVMQGVRHALNRPDLYPEIPIAFDLDDADFHLPHLRSALLRAVPAVAAVMAGSSYIADWCRQAGAERVHVVWTGAPVSARPRPPHSGRGAVIAWAQSRPMTYTPEASLVRQVVQRLAAFRIPGLTLRLYDRQPGDEPGFAQSFQNEGLRVEWLPVSAYDQYLSSFDDVSLGLAPLLPDMPFARGKSFGKVLAYLDRQVPIITSDACENSGFFNSRTGVITNDIDTWVLEARRLLCDPNARQAMAGAAFDAYRTQLTTDVAAARVASVFSEITQHNQPYPTSWGSIRSSQ